MQYKCWHSKLVFIKEDYRRTVTEIDEKEYISLKIIVSELRNQYVSHDLYFSYHRIFSLFAAFSTQSIMILFFLCEGYITRHDSEEHWEDQEASKQ